jgi:hypothetical protein
MSLRESFVRAAELIAAEQQGLSCLALRELGVPKSERDAYIDWLDDPSFKTKPESKSHELWMRFGDVHSREAREHRIIALLTYAETL